MIHVVLCQIGTIEALESTSIKKYLRRFLSDDRIIDFPKVLWRPIVEIIVLLRHKKLLRLYSPIWTTHGSPLSHISHAQQEALQKKLGSEYSVELFLSFSDTNSIDRVYKKILADGLEKIIIIPLFPQFSTATTSSVADSLFSQLLGWNGSYKKEKRYIPAIHFISDFYNHDAYKELYIRHVQQQLDILPRKPHTLIVSFHGLPRRYIREGDVYQIHCEETYAYIQEFFSKKNIRTILTYQSRFGAEKWLSPTTEDVVQELASTCPHETVATIAPGFVTDCLETLSEIRMELRNEYIHYGGKSENFFYLPCLNTTDQFIEFLASSVQTSASGFA